jgi:dTDP-4-dehydrorhamnose reductase
MTRAAPRPTIMLTGANGQIGGELVRTLSLLGRVVACTRAELPLECGNRIREVVRELRPQAIVNAAAYTAVDLAEREPEHARLVNGVAPGILAQEAARCDALMVHFSTDYVFDGEKREPYVESDEPHPLGQYGWSKLEGERAVAAAEGAYVTFRTGWIYGARGRNFLRTILGLAKERPELRVVDDQVGAPTWSRVVAEAVALVLARAQREGTFVLPASACGIHHLTAAGQVSWHGFADAILSFVPAHAEYACRSIVAVSSAEYPTPARRPAYSVLDNGRVDEVFGVRLPQWEAQLAMFFGEKSEQLAPMVRQGS